MESGRGIMGARLVGDWKAGVKERESLALDLDLNLNLNPNLNRSCTERLRVRVRTRNETPPIQSRECHRRRPRSRPRLLVVTGLLVVVLKTL